MPLYKNKQSKVKLSTTTTPMESNEQLNHPPTTTDTDFGLTDRNRSRTANVNNSRSNVSRGSKPYEPVAHRKPIPKTPQREPSRSPSVASSSKANKSNNARKPEVAEFNASDSDEDIFSDEPSRSHAKKSSSTKVQVPSMPGTLTIVPPFKSRSRTEGNDMEVDDHNSSWAESDENSIQGENSPLEPTVPESSNERTQSRSAGPDSRENTEPDSTASTSVSQSESGTLELSFDPNDPDWLRFVKSVKDNPRSAHERLSSELLEPTNCSALLGKLISRSISDVDENKSHSKRLCEQYGVTIIKAVLHLTMLSDYSSGIVVDLVNMMFTELRHFRTGVLYTIVDHCMNYMATDKDRDGSLPPMWIEVFGKIVSVMMTRGDIKHETDTVDGTAFRENVIVGLNRLKWTSENMASLIAVIRQIPGLEESDLKLIFHQVHTCIKDVKPCAFPPIVHQLILLAGDRCPSELVAVCAEYFKAIDLIDMESMEARQKRNALGTVLLHLLDAARHCDALVKAVIRIVKSSLFDFGKVMSPFTLSVVLGLSTFGHAKAAIIDPLRNSIMKSFHSLHLSEMSYWYRYKAGDAEDKVTACFKAILETKCSDLDLMFEGLRELGIGLLNADIHQNKYPNTLERGQKLGSFLITSLAKNCPDQLASMLRHLLKVSSKSPAHTECLAKCLEMRTRQIIHPSVIGLTCEIIRHLPMMDSNSAAMIVKSLSPALQLSYLLLDQIMLIIRKTIWKSVEAKRTAAKIMIILLSNSRVVGDIPCSQYSESQRFFNDSQNQNPSNSSAGQLPDNQPVCMEILTLTRRCFNQQREIREELYLGFHSVVRKNPALCEVICSQLYNHCSQYLSDGNNEDPTTVLLGKIVELPQSANGFLSTTIITEELGFLVQCLSFVVHKSHLVFSTIEDDPPVAVEKLEELLNRWIDAILKMDISTIEIMAAGVVEVAGGSRPMDTVRFVETLFTIQLMQIIEALIEFLNLENKPRCDKVVRKLFTKQSALEPLLKKEKEKVSNKKGKGDKDKTKKGGSQKGGKRKDGSNEDVTVLDDTSSETSENQPPAGGVKFKKPEPPKRLFYYHILCVESALDMLRKLQKADQDKGAIISVHHDGPDFEKFLLSTIKQKFYNFKRKESMHERQRPVQKIVETFADIAGCIWNGLLIHNLDDEAVMDEGTSEMIELRLEVVNEITTLLCSSHPSVCGYLVKALCDDDTEASYNEIFPKFFNSWRTVLGWIPTSLDKDTCAHLHQNLFDILHAFAKPLSPDSSENNGNITGQVLTWLWKYMSTPEGKNGIKPDFLLGDSVTSCWLAYFMKGKDFLEQPVKSQHDVIQLALAVKHKLGLPAEVNTQNIVPVNMWIVNKDTAPRILCVIMNHIETLLGHLSALLAKMKSHNPEDDDSKNKASEFAGFCFTLLNEIVETCSELVITNFPSGLCCSTMLKVVPQIFAVMTGFGEYIFDFKQFLDTKDLKRFTRPVSNIGKKFKPHVETMIAFIERVQREYADEIVKRVPATKRTIGKIPQAVKNQLLKEKRLIPSMIYSIEKYDQQIIMIAKKNDQIRPFLLVGMKLSNCRDFKVDTRRLVEVMNEKDRQGRSTIPDEETNMEAETTAAAGPSSSSRAPQRVRKAKKRKPSDDGDEDESNDAE